MRLRGVDFWAWTGLRRVNCGAVARYEGGYYDAGLPIPGCLVPELIEMLIERHLLVVADPDEYGWQRVTLSAAGRAEYQTLCRRRNQKDLQDRVPPPVHGTTPGTGRSLAVEPGR